MLSLAGSVQISNGLGFRRVDLLLLSDEFLDDDGLDVGDFLDWMENKGKRDSQSALSASLVYTRGSRVQLTRNELLLLLELTSNDRSLLLYLLRLSDCRYALRSRFLLSEDLRVRFDIV